MAVLRFVGNSELNDIAAVAVGITSVDADQRHVGIFYKQGGEVRFLHLAFHYELKNSIPKPCYGWVEPRIPAPRARQIAARCRQIWRANPEGLPYAFSSPNDCFDPQTSRFLLGPSRHGLTCSSFIVGVFKISGYSLVQFETWPPNRPGDAEWREKIISLLQQNGADPNHIEAVRREEPAARVRPEEVAAAAGISNLPASLPEVIEPAEQIIEELHNYGLSI